jgi:hypothetical protein
METYHKPREFVFNPVYRKNWADAVKSIPLNDIDLPIKKLVQNISKLEHCYTQQCCYGHFIHEGQPDPLGINRLAKFSQTTEIKYHIAYMAFCIENSDSGRNLIKNLKNLKNLVDIDRDYIQFLSADWFWDQTVNSYQIQVEPERFKREDRAVVSIDEALHLEKIRDKLYSGLEDIFINR